jgi:hypothetical protein
MLSLKLYYPNSWKKNVQDLVTDEDKKFNWFLCAKRYKDPVSNLYIAELGSGILFYEEKTGVTYVSHLPSGVSTSPDRGDNLPSSIKILIMDDQGSVNRPLVRSSNIPGDDIIKKSLYTIKKYGYDGIGLVVNKKDDVCVLCNEVVFLFPTHGRDILRPARLTECPLIKHARENYCNIKKTVPSALTPSEIDDLIFINKDDKNIDRCKKLYKDMVDYTRTGTPKTSTRTIKNIHSSSGVQKIVNVKKK